MEIKKMIIYKRGYLPKPIVTTILQLYGDKTRLKGDKSRETEYMLSKELINSCYGMIVTDICRDDIDYIVDEWVSSPGDIATAIQKYNENRRRFLFYPWGVWVTAYARRNLFSAIYEIKGDYCYADTDSVKIINAERHNDYFNQYNAQITKKVNKCLKYHKIPVETACPKTITGEKKPIGVWDYEGKYSRFKTLGAKRYMVEENGKIKITVSGVRKSNGAEYIQSLPGDVFDNFNFDLVIPAEATGKLTHTYIDDDFVTLLTDYNGVTREVSEQSAIHLENAPYAFADSSRYVDFLIGYEDKIY